MKTSGGYSVLTRSRIYLLALICCCFAQSKGGSAEPLSVSRVFPAGGQRGAVATVVFKGKFPNPELKVWTDRPGIQWTPTEETGTFQAEISPETPPGLYYIRLVDSVSASAVMPFIVGSLPEIQEVEPNQAVADAKEALVHPVMVNGVIEGRGDVDGFRIDVKAGSLVVASVQANQGLQSPVDMVMQFVDERGNVIATNHDYHGLDPMITWTSDRDRTVFVRVFGFPSAPDSSVSLAGGEAYVYRLTVTTGPYLEATQPLALQEGVENQLTPIGWGVTEGAVVSIMPSPGNATETVQFEGMAGSVELSVFPFSVLSESSLSRPEAVGELSIPICITGVISTGNEVDRFAFKAEKETMLIVNVESRALGCPLDAVLQIESAEGKVLQRIDDVGGVVDPSIRWKVPETGSYRVAVSDVNSWASPQAYYRLTIKPELPDFQLQSSSDLLVAKVGEPLEVTVKMNRIGGYDRNIQISLANLPEGVTCEPVMSEPSGDSSKEVKLKIICSQPMNGAIAIQGTEQSEASSVRLMRTDKGLESLWLYAQ